MPQTQDEFRSAVSMGATFMTASTHIANRDFDSVSAVLKEQAENCLNFNSTYTRREGFSTSSMTNEYYASHNVITPTRAELVIQYIPRFQRVGPDMPEGGFYWMVIDIEPHTDGTTKLMYYGTSGETKAYSAIKSWSDGEDVACPFS